MSQHPDALDFSVIAMQGEKPNTIWAEHSEETFEFSPGRQLDSEGQDAHADGQTDSGQRARADGGQVLTLPGRSA